jgi:hypothetical protein
LAKIPFGEGIVFKALKKCLGLCSYWWLLSKPAIYSKTELLKNCSTPFGINEIIRKSYKE